jgi:hypothetical protein
VTDRDNDYNSFVLSFDLGDEVFRVISVPNGMFSAFDNVYTSVFGGLLYLSCHDGWYGANQCCSIWVMKEYGVVDSWTKQCTVDPNVGIVRVLGIPKNGHILVEAKVGFHWELSSYDPESQQVKNFGIHGWPFHFHAPFHFHVDNFVENLVMLDKSNYGVSRRGVSRKRKCR